ncbi:hypothetical protein CCO02nite_25580 [Cellulomonas composti]|uniref:Uncharacterized protein n=1 Tax=Cellulomonas composti TaxID=266130 RepID=A0A511JD26_9CELL|nr:hypothetical protein CCO02nite_25580 [Cellulomonas composti]
MCFVEEAAKDEVVGGRAAEQAASSVERAVRGPDDQERQPIGRYLHASAVVVDAALLAAVAPLTVSRSGLSKCATG